MPIPIAALVAAAAAALSSHHAETLADAMARAGAWRAGRTIAVPTDLVSPEVRLLENAHPAELGTRTAPLVLPAAGRDGAHGA